MRTKAPIGILLTNIGSPEHCTVRDVRNYLRNFLGDPRVIKLPKIIRFLLLEGVILRTRPKKSLEAYEKVWTKQGAPLKIITQAQAEKLQAALQEKYQRNDIFVLYGMSYSSPFIHEALETLLNTYYCQHIVFLPLYPQYSGTTTASTFDLIAQYFKKREYLPSFSFINEYAAHPAYIKALSDAIRSARQGKEDWHLLFSFHGIPQDYADAGDPYKCFCILTAEKIAEQLGLNKDEWTLSFQSRLGPRAWLKPYTDKTLEEFPKQNIKKVLVACPGFASDCLETLEEIAILNKEIFIDAGGIDYEFIPCLNDSDTHIKALCEILSGYITNQLQST